MADVSSESYETFLYGAVDRDYCRHASFTPALLYTYIDCLNVIMNDPDTMDNNNIPLCNHMTKPLLLKDRMSFQCNCTLVIVIALSILCYAQSKRSHIVQRKNTSFAFDNNVLK